MPHLSVNGTRIYYEIHGDDAKPVVLFLHGLGSSVRDWELQVPAFSAEYRVLLIDMRGHGKSDKPKTAYSMAQFAQDVIAVMDHLQIAEAHVVGLSMGGMIAFQLAVDAPQRLKTLSIVNSGPAVVPRTFQERFGVWLRFMIVRLMGMRKMGETLAPKLFTEPDQEALRQTFIERWAENDPQAYLNALRAIVGWSVEDRIGSILTKTLILCAEHDYTPVAVKEAYAQKMLKARVVVMENAHHAAPIEKPDQFNRILLDFLRL